METAVISQKARAKVLHLIGKQVEPPRGTTGTEQMKQPQVIKSDDLRLFFMYI